MTRWDRKLAAELIQRYGCTHWTNISTMVIDFLAQSNIQEYDLHTLMARGGGGAPLPQALGERLHEITGLRYIEGYGLESCSLLMPCRALEPARFSAVNYKRERMLPSVSDSGVGTSSRSCR